jgi:hypothetical protein
MKFTLEPEHLDQLSFLDVSLLRKNDGTFQRKVYRKPTWSGQYIHFNSFVPLSQKRNLIRCLTERAIKICSDDCLQEELNFLKELFLLNGYPQKFIVKTIESTQKRPSLYSAEKKKVFINLPFKGDSMAEVITRRLVHSIGMTYMAANLHLSFSSTPLIRLRLKDKLPNSTTSFCVYSFACSCRASYVGRTTRRLSDRIREHVPSSLGTGTKKPSSSAITSHLVETDHTVNRDNSFEVIYRVPLNRSRAIRLRLLSIAEAIGIRLRNPELCVQKRLLRPLNLCWPTIHVHPPTSIPVTNSTNL